MPEKKKLVKTGKEIKANIDNTNIKKSNVILHSKWQIFHDELIKQRKQKYLVLPEGLDELEKMLRKEFPLNVSPRDQILDWVSSTIARFKKEQRIVDVNSKTCNNCRWAGELIDPQDELEPLKKYCPPEYLWNHPNPEECPNFVMKEQ